MSLAALVVLAGGREDEGLHGVPGDRVAPHLHDDLAQRHRLPHVVQNDGTVAGAGTCRKKREKNAHWLVVTSFLPSRQ